MGLPPRSRVTSIPRVGIERCTSTRSNRYAASIRVARLNSCTAPLTAMTVGVRRHLEARFLSQSSRAYGRSWMVALLVGAAAVLILSIGLGVATATSIITLTFLSWPRSLIGSSSLDTIRLSCR